ncbi:vacuolar protein 8 [Pisolithus croceorrhizus]|nr:vacuolar protein 8 [Pisolithus croceorrhizus]KAI6127495.1 vacuolar protein 8 [Pisolithus croceorrhizus]KAI6149080.1 vacuolar protein 8 [Pisolithus thermaeus]
MKGKLPPRPGEESTQFRMTDTWWEICTSCWGRDPLSRLSMRDITKKVKAAITCSDFSPDRFTTNFFQGLPLALLTTLSLSGIVNLQRSAALVFAVITEKEVRPVGRDTLDPILFLLSSEDTEVQRAASAALGNLAVNNENKLLIVKLGGLEPLVCQMLSASVYVQCNSVGRIANLTAHDDIRTKITESGALVLLTRLARSTDVRVQRNATGALLNMTHSDGKRRRLVNADATPVLVSLLNSRDTDVQYHCTTALSSIAVGSVNRNKLAETEPQLVSSLIGLLYSPSLKIQCQAALALSNLAVDEDYQLEIVEADGFTPLRRLVHCGCLRNASVLRHNDSPIMDSGLLQPIVSLLSFEDSVEVQCHASSVLRNLAANSDKNKAAIMEAGAAQKIKELVLEAPTDLQGDMTACIVVLALSGGRVASGDYSAFNEVWDKPDGGMHRYLYKFLTSVDANLQHIAVWTIMQLLEFGETQLVSNIRRSNPLIPAARQLEMLPMPSPTASPGTPPSHHSQTQSYQDTEADDEDGEIQLLRPRKAKGIESHSENSTASSSETLDDALPSPDRPVVGPSDTAHASITKVAAILTRASVVSTEKDKTSNVDVKGA